MRNSSNPGQQPKTNWERKEYLSSPTLRPVKKHLDPTAVTEADVLMQQKRKKRRKVVARTR